MLEIRDVKTSYGKIAALKGVSLDIHDGGLTCLLGPNGAGKTTLIWTIAGILKAQAGSMKIDGENILGLKAHQIVSKGIVTVPENRLVFPDMSVRENLPTKVSGSMTSCVLLKEGTIRPTLPDWYLRSFRPAAGKRSIITCWTRKTGISIISISSSL